MVVMGCAALRPTAKGLSVNCTLKGSERTYGTGKQTWVMQKKA